MIFSILLYIVLIFGVRYILYREPFWCKLVPPTLLALWIYIHDIFPFEFLLYTIGDHCMIHVNNLSKDKKALAAGILFFSLAHILSIATAFSEVSNVLLLPIWFILLYILYLTFVIITALLNIDRDLKIIIGGYAFILILRLSLSLLVLSTYDILSGFLFCISDLLIMVNMLFLHNKNISDIILVTYWMSLIFRTLSIVPLVC